MSGFESEKPTGEIGIERGRPGDRTAQGGPVNAETLGGKAFGPSDDDDALIEARAMQADRGALGGKKGFGHGERMNPHHATAKQKPEARASVERSVQTCSQRTGWQPPVNEKSPDPAAYGICR